MVPSQYQVQVLKMYIWAVLPDVHKRNLRSQILLILARYHAVTVTVTVKVILAVLLATFMKQILQVCLMGCTGLLLTVVTCRVRTENRRRLVAV